MGFDAVKALLFSGGIDSTAIAVWQRPDLLVSVDYGQAPAGGELRAATAIAERLALHHEIIRIDCRQLGQGHLAGRDASALGAAPEWWPYRNQLLVTVCAMRFVSDGLKQVLIGTVAGDEVHHDGRPAFVDALNTLLNLQEGGVNLLAPAIGLSSETLLERVPGVAELLPWTFSCHVSDQACGQCRGCAKHRMVLAKAGPSES